MDHMGIYKEHLFLVISQDLELLYVFLDDELVLVVLLVVALLQVQLLL
jgi:hypothetical protein